ncbi:MaoC/PaaZ C-terminal domain-containing protein [Blastococcus sp. SYSU D00813]
MDTTRIPFGRPTEPVESSSDPGEIAAFALAVNDGDPRYQDGRAVPPTYAVVPGLQPFLASVLRPDHEALAGGRGAGHGETDLYIHRPLRPGTVLRTTAEVSSAVTNRGGLNLFNRVASVDEDGELVYEHFWSVMYLGEVTGGDRGRPMADHTFPEGARSRRVGSMVLGTTADQTFRYAGASGDRAVIHVDDRAARPMTGDRGKFLQGLCTLGIASRALVALAAGGEPHRIRRIAVRFARYAFPGDEITVSVYDAGPADGGRRAFAFEAESGGQTVLRHGRVEVDPA